MVPENGCTFLYSHFVGVKRVVLSRSLSPFPRLLLLGFRLGFDSLSSSVRTPPVVEGAKTFWPL